MKHKIKTKIEQQLRGHFSFKLDAFFFKRLVVVSGVVFVWSGIWNFVDAYFFPEMPLVSNLASIVFGVFLLYLPDTEQDEHPLDAL